MYKWTMSVLIGIACVFGITVLFMTTAQHQSQTKQEASAPALPDTPLNSQAAEAIYKQSCIACHGNDLEGKIGPNLQKIGGKYSDKQLYGIVQNGRGGMPAFKSTLKDEEIVNLAKWLAEKQ
ncbi:Cytochrome c-551 precursor [Paenibacillus konkukensis]|uniref:Cytochrome c-551 n=1 Tax=Paenibacillus konkukensis TaxID=2020716 RepID=A0ABY4RG92_9BACL|nr:cytochrome c [Paenibacillus konkukensis]UQZ81203.1 Cytochrome c-551 precursor [Paenibacillus konkukensis]